MKRVKVNQPSTLQPFHNLHGMVGIADMNMDGNYARVYFTTGPVHSMEISKSALDVIKLSSAED